MAAVRLISTTTVHAANDRASSGRIELNTWDIRNLQIGYIQKGLLFPKPKLPLHFKSSGNMLIHHLKTSLSHTLHCFPLLAGRLATTQHEDDTISFFVDCNNAGVLFIHAAADGVTISDIIKPVYVPSIVHSFFSLNGLDNYKGITHPLLGMQITDLADGIFIGCSINHVVADGASFWHFLNSWSEISKGSIYLSKPPVFQRWFPDGMDIPIRIPESCVNVEQTNEDFILPPVRERIFHFSKENITKLKAKSNAEMGTDKISSLQALLSHIWRSAIHNRSFDPDQETNYRFVVGVRQRFQEIPDNYFGNAILGTFVTMKAKELVEQGIGNSAWRMNRIIAAMTGERIKKVFESWPASPSFVTLSNGDALITSSSPRFNMYGNDFGWGKPIAIRSGSSNKFDGVLTLYCGAEEGSIDIEAYNSEKEMSEVKYSGTGAGGGHICIIPFPACGHILPLMDLTHQLLLRGLTVTIMVTPKNLSYLNPLLALHSPNVKPLVFPFPSHPSLPHGVEQMQDLPISFLPDIVNALGKLYHPLVQWFRAQQSPPVAILSDIVLSSWTVNLASHLNIPNICFVPFNVAAVYFWISTPSFLLPFYREAFTMSMQSEGLVFNSFKELESTKLGLIKEKFAKHCRVWGVGPLPPVKVGDEGLNERGGATSIPPDQVISWLDSCKVDKSVVYIGFGTQITLTKHQMKAVASALEESGVRFIWAVKEPMKRAEDGDDDQSLIPHGFEDRVKGQGLVIKGWVPQLTILKHRAVGSYFTHCGWNSALEAIVAGVLLLAWPMQADHFQITRLLADEVGAAIRVCNGLRSVPDATKLARIFVESTTVGQPQRVRAMELQKTALNAIKEGGSSYQALDKVAEELTSFGCNRTEMMKTIRSSL